ncbi:MAG: hypothetical protein AAF216_05520 [Pseudomonadota bacterium]
MNDYHAPGTRLRRWMGAIIATAAVYILGIALAENPIEVFSQEEIMSVYGLDVASEKPRAIKTNRSQPVAP